LWVTSKLLKSLHETGAEPRAEPLTPTPTNPHFKIKIVLYKVNSGGTKNGYFHFKDVTQVQLLPPPPKRGSSSTVEHKTYRFLKIPT